MDSNKKKIITIITISIISIVAIVIGVKLVTKPNESTNIPNTVKIPPKEVSSSVKEISDLTISEDDISILFSASFPRMPIPKVTNSLGVNLVYSYVSFLDVSNNLIIEEFDKLKSDTISATDYLAILKPIALSYQYNIQVLQTLLKRVPENKILLDILTTYNEYLANLTSQQKYILNKVLDAPAEALTEFTDEYSSSNGFDKKINNIKAYFSLEYPDEITKFELMEKELIIKNKDYTIDR